MAWYRVGTANFTSGSPNIVGVGTAWLDVVEPGWAVVGPDGGIYEVQTVNSNLSIALVENYAGSTVTGAAYKMYPTQGLVRSLTQRVGDLIATYAGFVTTKLAGLFSAGSAGAPGVAAEGDVNTGLYWPAPDELAISAGGTEIARAKASGLGLGTSTPVGRLNVVGGSLAGANTGLIVATDLPAGRLVADATSSRINALSGYYDTTTLELSAGSTSGYVSGVVVTARDGTSDAPDSVSLWTRSLRRVTVDGSGALLVGTGTAVAGRRMVVAGGAVRLDNDAQIEFGGSSAGLYGNSTTNTLIFFTSTSEAARIDAAGNLVQRAPATPPALTVHRQLVANLINDTTLRFSARGSDGVTRKFDAALTP